MKVNHLCDLSKKDIRENMNEIIKIVTIPKYICEKCARVANEKKYLCNPVKIGKSKD
jgi:hypothetical protein